MDQLQFAYPFILWWLLPILIGVALITAFFKRRTRYRYALAGQLARSGQAVRLPVRYILFGLRFAALLILTVLIARPQWIDTSSSVNVQGVDIILTLDVSGSMEMFDDLDDQTSRIEAAKREALDFIEKRHNDPMGVVLFGQESLSKIPLTLDKTLLKDVVSSVKIGDVSPDGTAMMTALATSINRLRDSESKSKVIVLLTDGVPSEENISADMVIDMAQQFGIKIYTLGVGQRDFAYAHHPLFGVQQVTTPLDEALLKRLSDKTGGHFFRVYTPADLKKAYNRIDALEKTEINTTLFHNQYEAFAWFIWWFILLFALELFLRSIVWRGV